MLVTRDYAASFEAMSLDLMCSSAHGGALKGLREFSAVSDIDVLRGVRVISMHAYRNRQHLTVSFDLSGAHEADYQSAQMAVLKLAT